MDSILVDGKPIEEFRQKKYNYIFEYDKAQDTAPEISVESEYPVKILQATAVPGVAIIEVLSQDSEKVVSKYYINFNLAPNVGVPEDKVKRKVVSVDASAVPEAINTPQNTIDNDVTTKWASQGNQWISYDLGGAKQVDSVAIYWLNGDQRISPLQLQVSMDGKEWKTVYDGISSGKINGFETYSFTPVNTRFVRILCFGNNMTTWNSIMEVSILNEKAGENHEE